MSNTTIPIVGIPLRINPGPNALKKKTPNLGRTPEQQKYDESYKTLLEEIYKNKNAMPEEDYYKYNPAATLHNKWEKGLKPKIKSIRQRILKNTKKV